MVAYPLPGGKNLPPSPRVISAEPPAAAPIIAPPVSEHRAWVGGLECRHVTYQTACYCCYVAAGVAWPAGMVEFSCNQHTTACPACPSADICTQCGGIGEILPRNLMAHRMLSSPGASGDSNQLIGFVVPVAEQTDDAYWLAQVIEQARDMDGNELTCEQLLIVFDYLTTWAGIYESDACYWRLAGERVISLIGDQLRDALPEGCL